jgi:ABC-type dipeptide/oligopeptide/nickel transport system permease subunit
MPHLASTARPILTDAKAARASGDERLDLPRSAMIVLALSLASWTGIAFVIRGVVG